MAKYVIDGIAELNNINHSALYEHDILTFQVAAIFGIDEDGAESRVSEFLVDSRCAVERELLIKLLK
jgi:hypothetical protein